MAAAADGREVLPTRYRYSRAGFRRNLAIALMLTAMICAMVWLLLGIFGSQHMNLLTALTGLLFFAFLSARTLARFIRNDIVLAVQPAGIYDPRISPEPIAWERIKELVLSRRENEFLLRAHLWPDRPAPGGNGSAWHPPEGGREIAFDLADLDAEIGTILAAIGRYRHVRIEH